jgi:hypothetical protein
MANVPQRPVRFRRAELGRQNVQKATLGLIALGFLTVDPASGSQPSLALPVFLRPDRYFR